MAFRILCTIAMLIAPFVGISAYKATGNIWMIHLGLAIALVIGVKLLSFEALAPLQRAAMTLGIAGAVYGLYFLRTNRAGWNFICGGLALAIVLHPPRRLT